MKYKAGGMGNRGRANHLVSDCERLLRKAIEIGVGSFGNAKLPRRRFFSMILHPTGPGRHSGQPAAHWEIDLPRIWGQIEKPIQSSQTWRKAKDGLEKHIRDRQIKPTGLWHDSVEGQYLKPLITEYIARVGAFRYRHPTATALLHNMIQQLDSPSVEVVGLIALDGLRAARPFGLGRGLKMRPVTSEELVHLGRMDRLSGPPHLGGLVPRTDWWVCETHFSNPRGTAEGWNRIRDVVDLLALTIRGFKPSNVRIGMITQQLSSPFGRMMGETWGGLLQPLAVRDSSPYELSKREITGFVALYHRLDALMRKPQHYLHVAIRRLRLAGSRKEKEDALIDYVIGLESLLGEKGPELRYRFSIRGCVLLAKRKSERNRYRLRLRDLYDLRSNVVHGGRVSQHEQDLDEVLPFAEEALRRIWGWYFTRWYDRKDNRAGLNWIDQKLVN